jgi:hypothetical protein
MKRMCGAFTKVCVWMVVIVTAIPAPLMAQTWRHGWNWLWDKRCSSRLTRAHESNRASAARSSSNSLPAASGENSSGYRSHRADPERLLAGGLIRSAASFGRYENQTGTGRAI